MSISLTGRVAAELLHRLQSRNVTTRLLVEAFALDQTELQRNVHGTATEHRMRWWVAQSRVSHRDDGKHEGMDLERNMEGRSIAKDSDDHVRDHHGVPPPIWLTFQA